MRNGNQPSHLMELIMDYFTDMDAFNAETKAFLIKVGQVEAAKPKPTKKEEE